LVEFVELYLSNLQWEEVALMLIKVNEKNGSSESV
jgi:hypothetical protein